MGEKITPATLRGHGHRRGDMSVSAWALPQTPQPDRPKVEYSRKPTAYSKEVHRRILGAATKRGATFREHTKVGIAQLSDEEKNQIIAERSSVSEKRDKKMAALLKNAYDMSPKERMENPKRGALFNFAFLQTLPDSLKKYYIDHPEIEVDRESWKTLAGRIWGAPYVTYAYEGLCYIGDNRRTYLSPDLISSHFDLDNRSGDPEALTQFGSLTWTQVRHDLETRALRAGYKAV